MTFATIILLVHLRRREVETLTSFQLSLPKAVIEIIREQYHYSHSPTLPPLMIH